MEAFNSVRQFEKEVAEYCGSPYAVAVESCTSALFLSLKYYNVEGMIVNCPKHTYPGVACSIIHAGGRIEFTDERWQEGGYYYLDPLPIVDSAVYFRKNMYKPKTLWCLSFHYKKHIPIGRGGMVLTDDKDTYEWLKQARFDGRHECGLMEDDIKIVGWNCYMTPEQASRGLMLFSYIKWGDKQLPILVDEYPDLSKMEAYRDIGQ